MKPVTGLKGCSCCTSLRAQLLSRRLVQQPSSNSRTDRSGVAPSSGAVSEAGLSRKQALMQLPADTLERLQLAAKEESCSVDDLVTSAVEAWLEERKRGPRLGGPMESLDSVYVLGACSRPDCILYMMQQHPHLGQRC